MAVDEKAHCCLFCYRLFNIQTKALNISEQGVDVDIGISQKQFLQLLKRYFQADDVVNSSTWIDLLQSFLNSNESLGNVTSPCEDCSGIVKSFCEYFKEIKILEMKLSWKLHQLTNIVESSEKVKFRKKLFQVKLDQMKEMEGGNKEPDVENFMKSVKCFRRNLVKIGLQKLRTGYPRVALTRCDDDSKQKKEIRRASKRSCRNNDNRTSKRFRSGTGTATPSGSGVIGELLNEIYEDDQGQGTEHDYDYDAVEELHLNIFKSEAQSEIESSLISEAYRDDHCSTLNAEPNGDCNFDNIINFPEGDDDASGPDQGEGDEEPREGEDPLQSVTHIQSSVNKRDGQKKSVKEEEEVSRVSLRQRYRCKKCWRNFSTMEKLQAHLKHCDSEVNDEKPKLNDNDNDEGSADLEANSDEDDVDIDIHSPYPSEEEEEEEDEQEPVRLSTGIVRSRFKPYKTYDFMKTKFPCSMENCKSFFYNQSDLDKHSRHHGNFQCSLCSTTLSYAPDLARHELEHLNDSGPGGRKSCPREDCLYTVHEAKLEIYYIAHFLQAHLELSPNVHTCPICWTSVLADTRYENHRKRKCLVAVTGSCKISQHFKTCHDYEYNGIAQEEVVNCDCDVPNSNCSAYFLNSAQLWNHKKSIHKNKTSGGKDKNNYAATMMTPYYDFMKTKLKCPSKNCDSFFYNQADLDNHSKCHGNFPCASCNITKSYAPDLARHELEQHLTEKVGTSKSCPRHNCLYTVHDNGKLEIYFVAHFLKAHLQLSPNVHTCPVCCTTVPADDCHYKRHKAVTGRMRISNHFKTNHDFHYNGIPEEEVVHCDFPTCSAYFLNTSQLWKHQRTFHRKTKKEPVGDADGESRYTFCKICNEHFNTRLELYHHQVIKHGDKYGVICAVEGCSQRFRYARNMRRHIARDHDHREKCLACSICQKCFSTRDNLLFHQNQVHGKISTSTSTSDVDPPVDLDQEPGPDQVLKCSVTSCTQVFLNQENLQGHMKLHGIYQCQFCDKSFNYAPDLALHELSCHKIGGRVKKVSGEIFSCPRCTFKDICTEPQYVQHHLKFHLDVDMVVRNMCSVCKFVFKENYYSPKIFALHYRTQHDYDLVGNENGTVFRCVEDNCNGAYFLRADQFNLHNLIIHNRKERKLECEKCGKIFFSCNDLRKHNMRVHVPKEEWKHVCDECGKKFIRSPDLRRHKLSHVSEKPYACEHCGSMYKSRDKFRRHLKKLHDVILERPSANSKAKASIQFKDEEA